MEAIYQGAMLLEGSNGLEQQLLGIVRPRWCAVCTKAQEGCQKTL